MWWNSTIEPTTINILLWVLLCYQKLEWMVYDTRNYLSIEDGKAHIRTSAACMGQGIATMYTKDRD